MAELLALMRDLPVVYSGSAIVAMTGNFLYELHSVDFPKDRIQTEFPARIRMYPVDGVSPVAGGLSQIVILNSLRAPLHSMQRYTRCPCKSIDAIYQPFRKLTSFVPQAFNSYAGGASFTRRRLSGPRHDHV